MSTSSDVTVAEALQEDAEAMDAAVPPPVGGGWRRRIGKVLTTLLTMLITLAGLLLVTFVLGRILPTDPVLKVVGDRAPQDLYDRVYREMRLDKPVMEQFAYFASDMLQGRFGKSLVTGEPIASDIARYFPATFELVAGTDDGQGDAH